MTIESKELEDLIGVAKDTFQELKVKKIIIKLDSKLRGSEYCEYSWFSIESNGNIVISISDKVPASSRINIILFQLVDIIAYLKGEFKNLKKWQKILDKLRGAYEKSQNVSKNYVKEVSNEICRQV